MQERLLNVDTALVAPRTVIRRFREGDGSLLYECLQDNYSRLQDYFPQTLEAIKSVAEAEFFVRQRLADWHLQQEYTFGLWHSKDTRLIGMIRLLHIDWRIPRAEVGYFIDRDYAQQGLMTEAMQFVIAFAFRQLELEKIELRAGMENIPSQRLARKIGFRREGDLRADFRKTSGELIDMMLFGLTRSEWLGA